MSKDITEKILEKQADYVLSLKANQGTLYTDVKELFAYGLNNNFKRLTYDYFEDITKDHGQIETRRYWLITQGTEFNTLRWSGLKNIGMVVYSRDIDN